MTSLDKYLEIIKKGFSERENLMAMEPLFWLQIGQFHWYGVETQGRLHHRGYQWYRLKSPLT